MARVLVFQWQNSSWHDGKTDSSAGVYILSYYRSVSPSVTHYDIKVVFRSDAKITKRVGKSLEVGNDISKVWVANYVCGRDDGLTDAPIALVPTAKRVKVTDLTFLRDFIRQEIGNTNFEIKDSF
jgi:hypothetical protein